MVYASDRQLDNRSDFPGAYTDKDFIGTAYFFHSTDLLTKIAAVLGKQKDADRYSQLRERIRGAFLEEFVSPSGRLSPNSQSAYAIALYFDMLPAELRKQAAERIAENISDIGHITTGLLGSQKICPVLTSEGFVETAYDLLFAETYPSWIYMIDKGATTVWERWDSIKTDSSFQTAAMNSFNHVAFGSVGQWLYSDVGGIKPDPSSPGFKSFIIQPHPGGKMKNARVTYESLYGLIRSEWEWVDEQFNLTVEIPVNTFAKVYIPATGGPIIQNGKVVPTSEEGSTVDPEYQFRAVTLGSGVYDFKSQLAR